MSRRLLVALLLVVIACASAIAVALPGEDPGGLGPQGSGPATSAAARALLQVAGGPSGSALVTLRRWRYRADPDSRGVRERWARGDFGGEIVRVPYSPNAGAFSGPAGERAHSGSVGWFSKQIEAPVDGRYAVHFESAHYRAAVYIDGRPVRKHVGAYEPFTARARLSRGRHTIVVRADWRNPKRQAAEGWARAWFNYGGLNRPVTLARLGGSDLGALTVRTRLLAGGRARVEVAVRVRNRGSARSIHLRGALSRDGDVQPLDFGVLNVGAATSKTARASATIAAAALWSPKSPARYNLRIEVPGEATLQRKVGLRQLAWGAGGLKLNGERLVLRGAAMPADARGHGDALTDADEARIVTQLRAAGANATRSQMPLSQSMLDRLDAAGILVWQVIGPWEPAGGWRADTSEQVAAARDRAVRTAEAQQPSAAIVAWSLTNEASGAGQPAQKSYVMQTARRLHELDPTRPVAADIWGSHLPGEDGQLFSQLDAIGITDYVGWYDALDRAPAEQEALTSERLARLRTLFPNKALVVTELGAAGSERIGGDAFGGLLFQAQLLSRRLGALRDNPNLSGTIVWCLRDYALRPDFRGGSVLARRPGLTLTPGLNEKGLFDYEGKAKPALAVVRRAFAG
ncbi:MAG: beta-galactosidase [Solirubrobacteraceae bacterium]|nr:beta-galactosidase [Solirubrobacteraceae bacterium]